MAKQTQNFNAEIKQLLDLMIHSLYSHKEIFLRELISNASDAIDKLRFESLTNPELRPAGHEPAIILEADKISHTLKISDNGIGMSQDEVIEYIGTIAKSGTKKFAQMNDELKKRPDLIGQFGVGFYSAFMVADEVTLHTQKAGATNGVVWQSNGDGTYTIDEVPRPGGVGTTITLHLKDITADDEAQDFTDSMVLKSTVKKYSDFIAYPITMKGEKEEIEVLNTQKALWLKSPSEVTGDEYKEFYKHLTHDWLDPLKHVHYKAEGTLEFNALLYLPAKKPFNFNAREMEYGLSLYVKRVFIMSDCKELLPTYLRFVKGLVDSADLSLNVSREILQKDRQISQIRKNVTSKILTALKDQLKDNREAYEGFFSEFGATLKEGIANDSGNIEKIQDLLLFRSTRSDQWTTLDEYVGRMKEGQKEIYYITGDDFEQLSRSPYLEKLKQKDLEVLLMVDPVDEWVTQGLSEFKTKKLQSVAKSGLDLDSEEEKKQTAEERKSFEERFKPLMENLKNGLKDQVKDVVMSDRLTETPVCLVSDKNDPSAHMQKILSQMGSEYAPNTKRILEINPKHPLFEHMVSLSSEDQIKWADILFNQALLTEGSSLPDPVKFSRQIADLMVEVTQRKLNS